METKYMIGIALIAVIAVVGIAVFAVSDSNDSEDDTPVNTDGRMMVYGNANNDDYIDEKDVKELEKLIKDGTWDRAAQPYADTNHDGSITQSDVEMLNDMLARKSMKIWYKDCMGDDRSIKVPINNVVVMGTGPMTAMQIFGLQDHVIGRNHSANADLYLDPTLNETIFNNAEVVTPSSFSMDIGQLANLHERKGVDMLLVNKKTCKDQETQINGLGIPVVNMYFESDVNGANSFLTTGFILDRCERAEACVKFFDDLEREITEKVANIPDSERKEAVAMYGGGNLAANDLEDWFGSWILKAGAKSPVDRSLLDGKDSKKVVKGDTWHLIDQFNVEYVVYLQGYTYGYDAEYFADNYWNGYIERFSWDKMISDNYPNGVVLGNWSLYPWLEIAYIAEMFYPEIFGEGYGDKTHQAFIDEFYGDLQKKNYKCSDYCFLVTYDKVKPYL